jgi:hypothetical protein
MARRLVDLSVVQMVSDWVVQMAALMAAQWAEQWDPSKVVTMVA